MSIHLSPILRKANDYTFMHYCPGCKETHQLWVNPPKGPSWSYNGDPNKPSFTPSVKHTVPSSRTNPPLRVCHYFITDGNIAFCGDSTHALANKTVPLPEFPVYQPSDDLDE